MAEGERPILYSILHAQNVYLNSPLMFDGLLSETTTPCVSETLIVGTVSGAVQSHHNQYQLVLSYSPFGASTAETDVLLTPSPTALVDVTYTV